MSQYPTAKEIIDLTTSVEADIVGNTKNVISYTSSPNNIGGITGAYGGNSASSIEAILLERNYSEIAYNSKRVIPAFKLNTAPNHPTSEVRDKFNQWDSILVKRTITGASASIENKNNVRQTIGNSKIIPASLLDHQQENYPASLATKSRILPSSLLVTKVPTITASSKSGLNTSSSLYGSYGVPYNSTTTITFSLVNSKEFTVKVYNGKVTSNMLEVIKSTDGSRFEMSKRHWIIPLKAHDRLQVSLSSPTITVEPLPREIIVAAQLKNRREEQISSTDPSNIQESQLKELQQHIYPSVLNTLAPFQREGVFFILKNGGRALLADEMGLGKTRTAIASTVAYRDDWPVLVICPSSARHHWQAEILSLLNPDILSTVNEVTVVDNSSHPITTKSSQYSYKFVIISYNLVAKMIDGLNGVAFKIVIADECHYLKSPTAARTKCLLPILHNAKRAILLSGTPALSRPIELYTQLYALYPKQWPDIKAFGKRYCRDSAKKKGTSDFRGASNTQELHVMLTGTVMMRRLKSDVLSQLPKKKRYVISVPIVDEAKRAKLRLLIQNIENMEENLKLRKKSKLPQLALDENNGTVEVDELKSKKRNSLMELYSMSGEAKLPIVIKHLEKFLKNKMNGKILVFVHHKSVMLGLLSFLQKINEPFIRIDGSTSSRDRHSFVEIFQKTGDCRVALLAITAAGIALTLTAASTVYFAELFWTPGSLLQAEDRAHRIGQLNTVNITYFLANNSIDKFLWPLLRKKMKLLGEVVEGHENNDFGVNDNFIDDDQITKSFDELEYDIQSDFEEIVHDIIQETVKEVNTNNTNNNNNNSKRTSNNNNKDSDDEEDDVKLWNLGLENDDNSNVDDIEVLEQPDLLAIHYLAELSEIKSKSGRFPRLGNDNNNINNNMNNSKTNQCDMNQIKHEIIELDFDDNSYNGNNNNINNNNNNNIYNNNNTNRHDPSPPYLNSFLFDNISNGNNNQNQSSSYYNQEVDEKKNTFDYLVDSYSASQNNKTQQTFGLYDTISPSWNTSSHPDNNNINNNNINNNNYNINYYYNNNDNNNDNNINNNDKMNEYSVISIQRGMDITNAFLTKSVIKQGSGGNSATKFKPKAPR
eukprot:gene8999-12140_t